MYEDANDDEDDLDDIAEEIQAEDMGDEEMAAVKKDINMLNSKISQHQDALGETQSKIQILRS